MEFRIQITSLPHLEQLVAEIWIGEDQFALVTNEPSGEYLVSIYSHDNGDPVQIEYDLFMRMMSAAKKELQSYGY